MSPSEIIYAGHATLTRAFDYANWAHRNQRSKLKDAPYIVHPLHAVVLLSGCGFSIENAGDLDILVAAALHDSLEDNREEVRPEDIEARFGRRARELVESVTLDPKTNDKRASRLKLLGMSWREQSLKIADICSNTLRSLALIERLGLEETQQKLSSQPLAARFAMEWEFVAKCADQDDPHRPTRAHRLIALTLDALRRFEKVIQPA